MRIPARTLTVVTCITLTWACGGGSGSTTPTPTPPPPAPSPATGSLAIQITGLTGTGAPATVRVSGPGGFTRSLTSATTLTDLVPGSYTVAADPATGTLFSFAPGSPSAQASVAAGATVTVTVAYTAVTGALQVSVSGLPSGVTGQVLLTGPNNFTRAISASVLLNDLAPGTYTTTPSPATDVGIGYSAVPGTIVVAAGATATRAVSYALAIAPRSLGDRTDEDTSPKVKFLYVVPSDGTDRGLDTDGTMHRSLSAALRWFAGQTGGRPLRLDSAAGALDISFVRLTRTDAQMAGYGTSLRDSLEADLAVIGYGETARVYLAFYDGTHLSTCGDAARPPVTPGRLAAVYLRGLPTAPLPCAGNPLAASPTAAPGFLEFVVLHEILHLLGLVDDGAPNAVNGHVSHDPSDLMYAGALPWTPSRIDQSRTNYYNPGGLGGGLTNLAGSAFLRP